MTVFLLDVNVLVALFWPSHTSHATAHEWFAARTRRWATCPMTQAAFVRLVTNPAFSPHAVGMADAVTLLRSNTASPQHAFWPDDLTLADALAPLAGKLRGHRHVTDAYLVALAAHHRGALATLDRGLAALAAETPAARRTVEFIPG